jgi:hypothetical protein
MLSYNLLHSGKHRLHVLAVHTVQYHYMLLQAIHCSTPLRLCAVSCTLCTVIFKLTLMPMLVLL